MDTTTVTKIDQKPTSLYRVIGRNAGVEIREEPNDSVEDIVEKVVNHLSFYQADDREFEKGLCPALDENYTHSAARAVIHCLIRIIFHLNYDFPNESLVEESKDKNLIPQTTKITSFSRIHGVKINENQNSGPLYSPVNCKRGGKCPYVIGTAFYIWFMKKYTPEAIYPKGFEKLSGCGFYHEEPEVDTIREKVYSALDKIYGIDMTNGVANYSTKGWYVLANINRYLLKYNIAKLRTEKLKFFKLTNLSKEQMNDSTGKSRVKTLEMPIFTDEDIFRKLSIPNSNIVNNNQTLAILSQFDISNTDLFPELTNETAEQKRRKQDNPYIRNYGPVFQDSNDGLGFGGKRVFEDRSLPPYTATSAPKGITRPVVQ